MFCSSCGTDLRDDARFCPSCGSSLSASSSAALAGAPPPAYAASPSEREYAGFGARFVAWLIDNIVLIIPGLIVAVIVGVMFGALFGNADSTTSQAANDSVDTAMGIGVYVGYFIAWLAYNWIITTIGGGIGMRAMGIEIVDERTGHAPDAGKALGRTLVSIFSGFLYLGYLWAAWDDDRQTWHDKAAGTIVVRRIETARNARLTRTLPG